MRNSNEQKWQLYKHISPDTKNGTNFKKSDTTNWCINAGFQSIPLLFTNCKSHFFPAALLATRHWHFQLQLKEHQLKQAHLGSKEHLTERYWAYSCEAVKCLCVLHLNCLRGQPNHPPGSFSEKKPPPDSVWWSLLQKGMLSVTPAPCNWELIPRRVLIAQTSADEFLFRSVVPGNSSPVISVKRSVSALYMASRVKRPPSDLTVENLRHLDAFWDQGPNPKQTMGCFGYHLHPVWVPKLGGSLGKIAFRSSYLRKKLDMANLCNPGI